MQKRKEKWRVMFIFQLLLKESPTIFFSNSSTVGWVIYKKYRSEMTIKSNIMHYSIYILVY